MVAVGAVPRSLRDQVDIVSGLRQRDAFAVEYAAVIRPMSGANVAHSHDLAPRQYSVLPVYV